jgi:hypothetical protein
MIRLGQIAAVFLIFSLTSGCFGLLSTYMMECWEPGCHDYKVREYYPAVAFDLHGFRTIHEKDNVAYGLFYPILLADLAISFGVETAFMPLKAISNLFGPGSSAQSDIKDHSAGKTSANPE